MKITHEQLKAIVKEAVQYNSPLYKVLDWAKNGQRIRVSGKTVWGGLGNPSGLDSYGDTLIREKWAKSGAMFQRKMEALPPGTKVELYEYYNITRDRGKWALVRTITL